MEKNIILAGVGGQGILSISFIVCTAALKKGYNFKQAEVHGMAQRGGAVQAHLRLSDKAIHSDLIPFGRADLVLSVEPLESLRYAHYLSDKGYVVTGDAPFINIPDYPRLDDIMEKIADCGNHVLIDSKALANLAGSARAQNMVMLGAAARFLDLDFEDLKSAVTDAFSAKGEKIVQVNHRALEYGKKAGDFFAACIDGGIDTPAARSLTAKAHPDSLSLEAVSAWKAAFDADRDSLMEALDRLEGFFQAEAEKATQIATEKADTDRIGRIL